MKRLCCLLFAAVFAWNAGFFIPGGMTVKAEEAVSAIPEPVDLTTRSDFGFGVNIHGSNYPAYPEIYMEQQVHAVARTGGTWIRFGGSIPKDGDWTYLDTMVGLCNKYGLKIIMVVAPDKTVSMEYITTYFETFANRYNGKDGRGYVDIIQAWNEEDIPLLRAKSGGSSPSGESESHYYTIPVDGADDLPEYLEYFNAAEKGIHSKNSRSQMMINFSATHCGMITYFLRNGVKIDMVGWDLYATKLDREESAARQIERYDLIEEKIWNVYHVPVMICETNLDMKIVSDSQHKAAELSLYQPLFDNLYLGYARPWLKGAILYELLDESDKQGAEARYGLIRNTQGGIGITDTANEKPVYKEFQRLLGGNRNLSMIKRDAVDLKPYEKLAVETADDSAFSQNGTVDFGNSPTFDWDTDTDTADPVDISGDPAAAKEPIEVVIENIIHPIRKITEEETLYEIPWLMTVLCGASLLVVAGGGVVLFLILDKRKTKKIRK